MMPPPPYPPTINRDAIETEFCQNVELLCGCGVRKIVKKTNKFINRALESC